jgi:hypothetical protein
VIWLVLAAIFGCYLAGIGTGIGLAKAAARGDRRVGYLEIPPFVHGFASSTNEATGVVQRVGPYVEPKDQSAA